MVVNIPWNLSARYVISFGLIHEIRSTNEFSQVIIYFLEKFSILINFFLSEVYNCFKLMLQNYMDQSYPISHEASGLMGYGTRMCYICFRIH